MSDTVRRYTRRGLSLAICAGLAGCSIFNGASFQVSSVVSPYKIDIVQGNFVSSEQVERLTPGMNRQAVRDLLGTPLLLDMFHADRWDYVFTFRRKGEQMQLRKVSVFFNNTGMDHFEADALPTEAEFVASLDSRHGNADVPVLEASEAALKKFPPPAQVPEPPQLPPLPAAYPPLETTFP